MKNTLALLITLGSLTAQAQYVFDQLPFDKSCFVTLHQATDGKLKKASVPRKAHVRVSKDVNAGFFSKYFAGEPVEAIFFIEDAHTKEREYFYSTVEEKWQWTFERQTKYGLVHVECN